jgi:hypothetical protein
MPRPGDWKEYRKRGSEDESVLAEVMGGVNGKRGEGSADWINREVMGGMNGRRGEGSADLIDREAVESEWVESSTEKYKPPHIKSLEEKARMESAGW